MSKLSSLTIVTEIPIHLKNGRGPDVGEKLKVTTDDTFITFEVEGIEVSIHISYLQRVLENARRYNDK